ncbi:F-box/kelch-repeat protein [Capsicum annuum]|nr:F-box/kelch-repeat protein [Capsicum annuum]
MENVGFVLRTLRYMNWGLLEMGTIDQPLIPGLPDDLALRCLAKISHGYHGTLETVCRGWRKLFRSAEYSNYKAREGWSENWLFVLAGESKNQWVAYDPEADRWHPLPRIPTSHPDQEHLGFSCVCVLNKFLLIGGTYGTRDPVFPHQGAVTTNEVFQFDPFRKEWRKVASMRTPRSHFACSVVSGKVYVAGGRNTSLIEGLALAEVYNPLTDKISVPLNKEGDKDIVLGDLEHSRDVVILDTDEQGKNDILGKNTGRAELDTIKNDVLGALNHFYHNCLTVRSFTASFIALIPKRKEAMSLTPDPLVSLVAKSQLRCWLKDSKDKIRRDFLWEGNSESHKLLLVKLPKVTLPKHLGGSGIRDLAIHSKCMLMKWHRRFIQEDFGLWKECYETNTTKRSNVSLRSNSNQCRCISTSYALPRRSSPPVPVFVPTSFSATFLLKIYSSLDFQMTHFQPTFQFVPFQSSVLPLVAAVVERLVVEALLCRLLAGFVELIPKLDNRSWMSWTILSSRRFIDAILESIRVSIIAHSP